MRYKTNSKEKETNAKLNGANQHFYPGVKAFSNGEVAGIYKEKMEKAQSETGVEVNFYIMMPTHVHQLLAIESNKDMEEYFRKLNTSFAKSVIKIRDKNTGLLLFPDKHVFCDRPTITPQFDLEQYLITLSYYYHNADQLKLKEIGGGEYRKSAAWEYANGLRTIDNDPLLIMLGMTWKQLSAMMNLPIIQRMKAIHEYAQRQDPETIKKLFRINPRKPFTSKPMPGSKANPLTRILAEVRLR
ncbi:MAG: hypothetical protein PHO44_06015 [Sphaerochaetaceae bacterium]|nr:hypothetical protein [Sphaerochaetaceae bacterium]MDD3162946.1 hypothetical protein [Sphaerochaetaceae bacterium]MDD4007518.1 hypothetical protein [Sphaerochaetaceae bacterium]MDD4396675.1 hypothetical protein [Sphaerochaetaceae bacterium]